MAPRGRWPAALTVIAVLWSGSGPAAQGDPVSHQERAQLRFQSLHESMQRLQVALSQSSPTESATLRAGNKFILEARIGQRMQEVKDLLGDGQWDEAIERMNGVRGELEGLMKLLLDRERELEELLAEEERLQAFKDRVDQLIADQQEKKEDAARSEKAKADLEGLEQAAAKLAQLAEDQAALRDKVRDAGSSTSSEEAEQLAAQERDLQATAAALADRLAELEEARRSQGGESKSSADADCSEGCERAAAAMSSASSKLASNQPSASLDDMDRALDELRAASEALEALAGQAERDELAMEAERQASAQEAMQADTEALSDEMATADQGEQGQPSEPAPGAQSVQRAIPEQAEAAGQLRSNEPGRAKQHQQDAKEELEKASEELSEALAELQEQLHDEVLRALEERFEGMLATQRELSAKTKVTDRLRDEALTADGSLPSAIVKRCEELSSGELELSSEAGEALSLLKEEGTTVVMPELVAELKGDLDRVGGRLVAQKTDRTTQSMQVAIEDSLQMLIDALRSAIEESESGSGGQCDGEPPLLPTSAELKLVLALQKRVHARTRTFDEAVPRSQRAAEPAQVEAGEIARKQARVKELTRKLAEKLSEQAEERDR